MVKKCLLIFIIFSIVLEYCEGGSIIDYIKLTGKVLEEK